MERIVAKMDDDIKSSMRSTARGEPDQLARSGSRSLPGHPPAVQTATLIGSVFSEAKEDKEGVFGVVGSRDAVYAKAMEFGFEPKNLAPRPWLFPAFERIRGKVTEMLNA
jgi:hypothetical protein